MIDDPAVPDPDRSDDSAGSSAPPVPGRRPSRSALIRYGFLVVVVALVAWWIWRNRVAVGDAFSRVTVWSILLAFVLALAGAWTGAPAWRVQLRGLGYPVGWRDAQRVFLLGQLGKYIPGGVWSVLAQATMAQELHIPRSRSGTASLLGILISVVTAGSAGALLLSFSGREVLGQYGWTLLLILPLVVLLHPAVLVRCAGLAARITHRQVAIERIDERYLLGSAAWLLGGQLVAGLQLYVLAGSIAGTYPSPFLAVGLFLLATAAGVVFVIAPAGAGIRELVLVLGMSPIMDSGAALSVALISRLISTVADFVLAGTGAVLRPRR